MFIKYRVNSGEWMHAQLSQTDFVAAAGSTIDVSSDGVGAFVYRDSDGSGDLNLQNMRLSWDYSADGIDPNDILDIQVFALEMVYIPEGAFYVGGTTSDDVAKFHEGGNTTKSYHITSEAAITIANTSGNLYYNIVDANPPGDQSGPIPAAFPKGFNAFYIMKYEMSQAQFVGFFNTLTDIQKTTIDVTTALNGYEITWAGGSTNATTTAPDRAVNFISVNMTMAYLDWAGLRHMTELEFEKACRGPLQSKPGEYAWGNANLSTVPYTIINPSEPTELISNISSGIGNANYSTTRPGGKAQPLRNGIFAASAINKNREETGGSYYGVMELSGNLWEPIITIGSVTGRNYTGLHGDGSITSNGLADVVNWSVNGSGLRGGSTATPSEDLSISSRRLASYNVSSGLFQDMGARGGRSF